MPTQALTLLNNQFFLTQAERFAARIQREAGDTPEGQVRRMYEVALARAPSAKELAANLTFLSRQSKAHGDAREALVDLADVVLNLNEFVYLQ